jgi:peptide-methionine (S)-S-oxide reductase
MSTESASPRREVATLGGGCFWCLEAVFEQMRGVEKVESATLAALCPTHRTGCLLGLDGSRRGCRSPSTRR